MRVPQAGVSSLLKKQSEKIKDITASHFKEECVE